MRFVFLTALLGACAASEPVRPMPPPEYQTIDASVHSVDELACANLLRLGCPEGSPSAKGDPCVVVIQRSRAELLLDFKPKCLAEAGNVSAVRECGTVRCKQ